jgi:hypothetical protein
MPICIMNQNTTVVGSGRFAGGRPKRNHPLRDAGPMVRIRLPPAASPANFQPLRLLDPRAISTSRLPHCEHTSRSRQSTMAVPSPYRRACSAGPGSTWCWQPRHHTINRTPPAAAAPSVSGGPGSDFTCSGCLLWVADVLGRDGPTAGSRRVSTSIPAGCHSRTGRVFSEVADSPGIEADRR